MRRALTMVVAAATGFPLAAQDAPNPPVFKTQAEMVVVDVVVTDGTGRPVRGLTRDDFTVAEDGTAQEIATFEAIDRSVATPEPVVRPATLSTNTAAASERPTIVVAFDEQHLSALTVQKVRRRLAEVWDGLGAADVLVVSSAGGSGWLGRLPEDEAGLQAALDRYRGLRVPESAARMTSYEAYLIAARANEPVLVQVYRRYLDQHLLMDPSAVLPQLPKGLRGKQAEDQDSYPAINRAAVKAEAEQRWKEVRQRQRVTFEFLLRLLDGLGKRPGRKAVVLVSEGFLLDPGLLEQRQAVEAARRARAAVHVVDPRDSGAQGHDAADFLRDTDFNDAASAASRASRETEGSDSIASATGGRIIRSMNGLPAALADIGAELRTYYLLGYAPAPERMDGRYHKLRVQVNRPGLRVQARPGYFAVAATSAPARASAEADVQAALASPFDAPGLPIDLAGYVLARGRKGNTVVRLVAEVGAASLAENETLDVVFQLVGRDAASQQAVLAAPIQGSPMRIRLEQQFEAPPGAYQARVVVRERGGTQRVGSVRHPLEVKPQDAFRLSTPILTDVLLPDRRPLARAERRFHQGSTLHCLVEVMGAAAAPVQAGVEVRGADGRLLLQIPDEPIAAVPPSRQWAIPLHELPAGRYELVISVQAPGKAGRLESREPFEVLEGAAPGPTA